MKQLLLIILFLSGLQHVVAQKDSHRERLKAYKIAYLTEELNLSPKEAQSFWPLYNTFEEALNKLKKEERTLFVSFKDQSKNTSISDQEAEKIIDSYTRYDKLKFDLKNQFLIDLRKVISSKKILLYIKAEKGFNRKLMKRYRHNHSKRRQ